MADDLTLFISAGELSGDVYAAEIIKRLRQKHPKCHIVSLGGHLSEEAGSYLLADTVSLATFGLWELVVTFRQWRGVWAKSRIWIHAHRPLLVLIIDNPGFNLRLARYCRTLGVPVISFVPPQVWVWGARRAQTLSHSAARILTLFPWEAQYFKRWGGKAEWVGHPLTQLVPKLESFTPMPQGNKIVLFPGSRRKEVQAFLDVLVTLLPLLHQKWSNIELVVVLSRQDFRALFTQVLTDCAVTYTNHDARYQALQEAALCVSTCGTVTLEVALTGVPQVIVYRVSQLTYWMASLLLKRRFFGLPNIIMDREIAPELIQHDFTAQNVFHAVEQIWDHLFQIRTEARMHAQAIRERLSCGNPFDNVVGAIEQVLSDHDV